MWRGEAPPQKSSLKKAVSMADTLTLEPQHAALWSEVFKCDSPGILGSELSPGVFFGAFIKGRTYGKIDYGVAEAWAREKFSQIDISESSCYTNFIIER